MLGRSDIVVAGKGVLKGDLLNGRGEKGCEGGRKGAPSFGDEMDLCVAVICEPFDDTQEIVSLASQVGTIEHIPIRGVKVVGAVVAMRFETGRAWE